jgi:hypothetical protein
LEFSVKKYKKARIVVLVAFVVVALLLVSAWAAIPKIKSHAAYFERASIRIDGNDQFTKKNGVLGGSGTESDPYIIESWGISSKTSTGILLMNTDSHVIIRNVTVNGLGYYYFAHNGIELRNSSNVIIENAMIRYGDYGILVQPIGTNYSKSVSILNCTVQYCDTDIYLGKLSKGSIEGCGLMSSRQPGAVVENCTSILLSQNYIERGRTFEYYGYYVTSSLPDVLVQDTSNITMQENLVYADNYYYTKSASILRCDNVTVSGNYFAARDSLFISASENVLVDNNTGDGFSLTDIRTCTIADNIARNSYGGYYDSYNTLRFFGVVNTKDLRMLRNLISYIGGIQVQDATDAEIVGNLVTDCSTASSISGSRITISDNLFDGLTVSGYYITIEANDIATYYSDAFEAYGSSWLNISDNSIAAPSGSYAVVFYENQNFRITNNSVIGGTEMWELVNGNISGNEISGPASIDLWGGVTSGVHMVHNSLFNVSVHNNLGMSIAWDDGYPYGGNYWSQYSGVDTKSGANQNQPGADGIGDSPYDVYFSDTDEYPLMTPIVPADTSPPITAVFLNGVRGDSGWYRSAVNFTFVAFDNIAGVNSTYYRIDSGSWTEYTARVFVAEEGIHTLEYYSTDNASNSENVRVKTIRIDSEHPQALQSMRLRYQLNNTDIITIPIQFEDNTSGIRDFQFSQSGQFHSGDYYTADIPYVQVGLSNGSYEFVAVAYDTAGNSYGVIILVNDSLMVNRDPLSTKGPYGPWYEVGLIADLILFIGILWLSSMIYFGPVTRPMRGPDKEPGEIDKEDVIDGYPKYLKRM